MKLLVSAALAALVAQAALAQDNPLTDQGSWADLKDSIVGDAALQDGSALFSVDAPYRANDAATVPIEIVQTDDAPMIDSAMVVIDENPAPVAAELTFGPAMHPLKFDLRVRVNQYSNVRVIAETDQGSFMNGRFVKASGGCSAPASRDPELALASMGEMKLRSFGETQPQMSTPRREAAIMIRHPNYSGLQRDQVTQLFIGAHFIDHLEVYQGDEMLFTLDGGISISENPVFRFTYTDNGSPDLRVHAEDTEGNVFDHTLPKDAAS
ncbi:quinoprotein dehydrogenase-associated SoxYZ-like carrier [Oceaniglobus roseus]|uniref:quinoprotein dehydrogenase-associated SoxYZ-like carrier n=1 Tax=Oceaniglobus roseus TaxID=1737570 RepID=UPI000C7F3DD7|nr:quinoprotein dehydrogenase-associated SoxYZ-like carrier [Kandeliimicrobium roseum]